MSWEIEAGLGFSALHMRRAATDSATRTATLDLIESPTWGAALRYFRSVATPGHDLWRRPGMIPAKSLREFVDAALQSESVASAGLGSARDNGPGFRRMKVTRDALRGPFSTTYGVRPFAVDADPWIEQVVTFLDRVESITGVVVAMDDVSEVSSECGEGGVSHNGRLMHPFPDEFERMRGSNGKHIGTRYMRFPRWGTLVSHDHVAQLGGVEAITAAVQPAVVRSLAGGVYFQLTASVASARGDEAAAKQRAFTAMAGALLPPANA